MNVLIYLYDGIVQEVRVMSTSKAEEEYDRWIDQHGFTGRDDYFQHRERGHEKILWFTASFEG